MNLDVRPANLPSLTSLRFIAALMIVFMHVKSTFAWPFIPHYFVFEFGVSFFFILSGFILAHNYLHKKIPFGKFMQNRLARLWPAHLLWLAALVVLLPPGWRTFGGTGFLNEWVTLVANIFMVHSLVPLKEYFFSWNDVSWSISTEMFFYFAFLPIINNIYKTWHYKIAATFLLFCTLHMVQGLDIARGLNVHLAIPLARVFEFCLGICAYLLWERIRGINHNALVALAASGILMYLSYLARHLFFMSATNKFVMFLIMRMQISLVFAYLSLACFIIAVANGKHILGRFLGLRGFVYLGEISYSVYLCHQVFVRMFVSQGPESYWSSLTPVWQAAFYFPLVFVSSVLSYQLVENPARRFLKKIDSTKLLDFAKSLFCLSALKAIFAPKKSPAGSLEQ